METKEEVRDGPPTSAGKASKAPKGRKEELTTITETRAEVDKV